MLAGGQVHGQDVAWHRLSVSLLLTHARVTSGQVRLCDAQVDMIRTVYSAGRQIPNVARSAPGPDGRTDGRLAVASTDIIRQSSVILTRLSHHVSRRRVHLL